MKNKLSKLLAPVMSLAIAGTAAVSLAASAGEPYDVYNYDRWGEAIPSQAGYIADRVVRDTTSGSGHLKLPETSSATTITTFSLPIQATTA